MGYASKQGRTRISSRSPSASGQCDRCGFLYNHNRLRWQMDWAGASLINKRILVCDNCYDKPQQQLRSIVIPADPVPVMNPRVPDYVKAETDLRGTSGQNTVDPVTNIPVIYSDTRVTTNGYLDTTSLIALESGTGFLALQQTPYLFLLEPTAVNIEGYDRVTQQTGEPYYGLNQFPGTILDYPGNGNGDIGLPYGFEGIPQAGLLPGVNYAIWLNSSNNPLYWMPGPYETWNPPTTVILNWVYEPPAFTYPDYVTWVNSINDNVVWENNSLEDIYWE